MSAVRVAPTLRSPAGRADGGERKVVLRLGDALDREGAPDALERVAGHFRDRSVAVASTRPW